MNKQQLKQIIDVAAGRVPADVVFKQAKIIDVYQAAVLEGDVAVVNGVIAGIGGDYEGKVSYDLQGKYLAPGLIESHIHVESSYVTPEEFGRLLVPHGTTTVLADPHEIVNVLGLKGLDYMLEAARGTALDIRYMLPSCVPATNMENAGAVLTAEDMLQPMKDQVVDGLAEFMDFPGVIQGQDAILDKLLVAKNHGKRIDGHAPMVFAKDLNAYAAAGITNDHESSTIEELQDRIARGMYAFLREGSVTQNLRTLIKGVTVNNSHRCVLVADDLQAASILEVGHLDNSIRICIEEGLETIRAIQMATINAAQCCQLPDRGAVAPGLKADFIVFSDLEKFAVEETYIDGVLVAKNGEYLPELQKVSTENVQSSVHIDQFHSAQLQMHLTSDKARAIEVVPKEALTNEAVVPVQRDASGDFIYDAHQDVTKIAVIERHHNTGNVFVGLLKNYGLKKGAIGLSIAHDSHNLIVTGTNDADMTVAVEALKELGGGVVLVNDQEVIGQLALPIAGLMSDLTGVEVAQQEAIINQIAHEELGISTEVDPIMTLGFMSLAVIPSLKITDLGLVDVTKFEIVPVSVTD
ncbi:adenine deaminase [Candidatus Enterococcus ferrettii]|uniref:Adenine deaminase n=1 Tax=Candidatus Enterococcus ferrettii TaxID=2815324 RepID=A0ABV0EVV0_9ENTE|nr:adenine deaminase [Enterococcus sp. 665A]MBO1341185.1 adenine deaminase [Enterococcus sp. 665A]